MQPKTNPETNPETNATQKRVFEPETGTGAARCDPGSSNNAPAAAEEINALVFDCERIAIYHSIRRGFWDRLRRSTHFLVVLFGTAAFASIQAQWGMDWLALLPALFSMASLVFDFSGQAHIHDNLYRRVCDLRGNILSDEQAALHSGKWQKAINALYADEPTSYRALDAWAHNLVCKGRGQDEYGLKIPKWHLAFKNILPFWSAAYATKQA